MEPAEARDLLGVGPDADSDALHLAYRTRARSVHPDVGGSWDEMARINEAYSVLRRTGRVHDDFAERSEQGWSDAVSGGSSASRLRRLLIVLVGLGVVVVAVVFVAAVGYDWSVGTP